MILRQTGMTVNEVGALSMLPVDNPSSVNQNKSVMQKLYDWMKTKPKAALGAIVAVGVFVGVVIGWAICKFSKKR